MRRFVGFEKGINLGGWLSQTELTREHMDTFITEEDFRKIKTMGLDHVRLPIDYELVEDEAGCKLNEGYDYIERAIDWAYANGLNLVLDLHKTCGYVFDDDEYSAGFFGSESLQDRFINLWRNLAKRFGSYHEHVAFELLNEVVDASSAEQWNEVAERCIRAIRELAPDTWLLIGGTRNNAVTTLKDLRAPLDDKIVFNFHCYEPLIFTHQAAQWIVGMPADYRIDYPKDIAEYIDEVYRLINPEFAQPIEHLREMPAGKDFFRELFREAVEIAAKFDVPLYCGEYGVIDTADADATLRWFEDIHAIFEEYGISRAAWSYKEMNFGITGSHYEPVHPNLIDCL